MDKKPTLAGLPAELVEIMAKAEQNFDPQLAAFMSSHNGQRVTIRSQPRKVLLALCRMHRASMRNQWLKSQQGAVHLALKEVQADLLKMRHNRHTAE